MEQIALPRRQEMLNQLYSVQTEADKLMDAWKEHIAKVEEERRTIANIEPLMPHVPFVESLAELGRRSTVFNDRLDILRSRGFKLDPELNVNLGWMIDQYLDRRRGTETAGWRVKTALPEIEGIMKTVSAVLSGLDRQQVERLNTLLVLTGLCVERESDLHAHTYLSKLELAQRFRHELEEEVN